MPSKRSRDEYDDDYEDDEYEEYEDEEGDDDEEDDDASGNPFFEMLYDASWRRLATVPLILILFGFGAWLMWKKYGHEVLAHSSFQIDPYHIQYTPPPDWLERDVLKEVVKIGSLDVAELQQPELVLQVVNAFELHPWVKRVVRVRKGYPAKMAVEVSYRNAVAMVALPPRNGRFFLQPIDGEAVILPDEDFNVDQARSYPRIDVGRGCQGLPDGAGWGDPLVVDAAKIAEALYGDWENLGKALYEIQLSPKSMSTTTAADFDIRGRPDTEHEGLLIHWGRAPGSEQAGEPIAAKKLENLKQWMAAQQRSLKPSGTELDLRSDRIFPQPLRTGSTQIQTPR